MEEHLDEGSNPSPEPPTRKEKIMKGTLKEIIVSVLGVLAFLAVMGIAGSHDLADQVVYTMDEEVYYTILDTLGDDCSNIAVANEYIKHREYYDNLQY